MQRFEICVFIIVALAWTTRGHNVHYLEHNETFIHEPSVHKSLEIFCYRSEPKNVIYIWHSIVLHIEYVTNDYVEFEGFSPEDVQQKHREHSESWTLNPFSLKDKKKEIDLFNSNCIGLLSRQEYSVTLNIINIDFWKVLLLALGVFTFWSAGKLSRNTVFHYVCGIVFGICASFLIVLFVISKLIPRRTVMYGIIGCGWTINIYILNLLWENVGVIIYSYSAYVLWYIIATGFISFIVCYRWGAVKTKRTINLIQWTLQFLGLVAIFYSSHYKGAAMGQIVILLLSYNFPKKWTNASRTYWMKKFSPKVKLLSNEEYYEQGVRETAKALDELRKYCTSPECNQWKTALNIKDIKRFVSFIEGSSHLLDEEILEYSFPQV